MMNDVRYEVALTDIGGKSIST